MSKLLCRLSQVPLDEKLDLITLLEGNNIHFYETDAGFWGVGIAALWLSDELQYERALQLFDDYQLQREESAKLMPAALSSWQRFLQKPVFFVVAAVALCMVLAVSIYPFML